MQDVMWGRRGLVVKSKRLAKGGAGITVFCYKLCMIWKNLMYNYNISSILKHNPRLTPPTPPPTTSTEYVCTYILIIQTTSSSHKFVAHIIIHCSKKNLQKYNHTNVINKNSSWKRRRRAPFEP